MQKAITHIYWLITIQLTKQQWLCIPHQEAVTTNQRYEPVSENLFQTSLVRMGDIWWSRLADSEVWCIPAGKNTHTHTHTHKQPALHHLICSWTTILQVNLHQLVALLALFLRRFWNRTFEDNCHKYFYRPVAQPTVSLHWRKFKANWGKLKP